MESAKGGFGRRQILFVLIIWTTLAIVLGSGAEIALRLTGRKPFGPVGSTAVFEPSRGYYTTHPTLGYAYLPGRFKVTLPGPFSFRITHAQDGHRITHPVTQEPHDRVRKEIWIFGCSFTHGWSLNDEETYAWLLQERLPDYEIVNFGVEGYGTVQSLIQFREALEQGRKPQAAIFAYASFHDERNVLSRTWKRTKIMVGISTSQLGLFDHPVARLSSDGRLELTHEQLTYSGLPLSGHLALSNFLETRFNALLERNDDRHAVTRAVFEELFRIAKEHEVTPIIAALTDDSASTNLLQHVRQLGMPTVDMSVDLSKAGNSNAPYDGHPSAAANREYAAKLLSFLCNSKTVDCY